MFGTKSTHIGTERMTVKPPNTSKSVERYREAIVACLHQYVKINQRDQDVPVQPYTY